MYVFILLFTKCIVENIYLYHEISNNNVKFGIVPMRYVFTNHTRNLYHK